MFASTHAAMNVGKLNAFAANDLTAKFRKMTTAAQPTTGRAASKALVIESTCVAMMRRCGLSEARCARAWTARDARDDACDARDG